MTEEVVGVILDSFVLAKISHKISALFLFITKLYN